jgi:hypothetical protein
MASKLFHPLMKQFLKIAQMFKTTHVELDTDTGRLKQIYSKNFLNKYKIGTILHQIYALSMGLHLLFGNLTTLEKIQGTLFFVTYAATAILRTGYKLDDEPIQVINMFLDFEEHLIAGKVSLT